MKLDVVLPDPNIECEYCGKKFSRPKSAFVHVCAKKKRAQSKSDPGSRYGFIAFAQFYRAHQSTTKPKTFEDFINSPYYNGFVKFGWYAHATKCIAVERFVDWLLKKSVPLERWASDKNYSEFLEHWLPLESVSDALARAIETSVEWASESGAQFNDILRYGAVGTVLLHVMAGRLSPWVLYCSASGKHFLSRLSDEQIGLIFSTINPQVWNRILSDRSDDKAYATSTLQAAGW